MEPVISVQQLTKYYGKHRGVRNLTFRVEAGELFGFLGPNGAGKTTTIRLLLNLLRPTGGTAALFGQDVRRQGVQVRRQVGYLPGDLALYGRMTGRDYLTYMGNLRGGVQAEDYQTLAERLDCDLTRPIRELSKGNRQKIGIIQAVMHGPQLVIMDEPTPGLDPLIQHEVYQILVERKAAGVTVFLSSHNLPEVERICDRVGIIREGQLAAVETVTALKNKAIRRLEIHFTDPVPQEAFAGISGVQDVRIQDGTLTCTVKGSLDGVVKAAARFEVVNIISHDPSLEEIFLAYYN